MAGSGLNSVGEPSIDSSVHICWAKARTFPRSIPELLGQFPRRGLRGEDPADPAIPRRYTPAAGPATPVALLRGRRGNLARQRCRATRFNAEPRIPPWRPRRRTPLAAFWQTLGIDTDPH